jgi:hypothetical protein
VTGVARKPILISSSSALLSARMSFATYCTPFRERNSFSCSHAPQPGCEYTTTCLAMVSSSSRKDRAGSLLVDWFRPLWGRSIRRSRLMALDACLGPGVAHYYHWRLMIPADPV